MTQNTANNDTGRELGWDDELENDGKDFIVIPAGEYEFQVTSFDRTRFNGSAKVPPCNKAIYGIDIMDADGKTLTTIKHNLLLHSKLEPRIREFFRSTGKLQHGEKKAMPWTEVVGSVGRCKIGIRQAETKDGRKYDTNEIEKFIDPPKTDPAAPDLGSGAF